MNDEPSPAFLDVRSLWKSYVSGRERLQVLKGVDLTVERGEVLAIIGPSGVGKSTLLHIMGALDRPDAGAVFLEGREICALPERERAVIRNRSIGFIFQFYHLLPEFTALENVAMPAMVLEDNRSREHCDRKAMELLEAVGIADRAGHRPSELSGGEQQRVAIARALMNEPELVLADEPSGNLDTRTSRELHRLITDLNERFGQTFVIVTHDEELAGIASRRAAMREGKVFPM